MQAFDIISSALVKIGVYAPGESISAPDINSGLDELNQIMDALGVLKNNIWAEQFLTFTLIPNHQPHTIGVAADSPDFVVLGNRPTKIIAGNIVLNNVTPNPNYPLNIRDSDWWASERVQGLSTAYPTDLYFEPDWPKGSCFFWPIPTSPWPVQLQMNTPITTFTLNGAFSMPPGYHQAILLTLAESLCVNFERPITPDLARLAAGARAAIRSLNARSPRISTGGDGVDSGQGRSSWNWRTGQLTGR